MLLEQIDVFQKLLDSLAAHSGNEVFTILILSLTEFDFRQELSLFKRGLAWINDDVILVIDHALKLATGKVEHETDARRHALVKPDVGNRHCKVDVTHALAAHATQRDLDTATVADNILVLDTLVLSAGAFPIPGGTENTFAEQTTLFRLEGPIVDGLGILDLPFAPTTDGFRSCNGDSDLVKGGLLWIRVKINGCECCFSHGS